jgi:hypothetical protein
VTTSRYRRRTFLQGLGLGAGFLPLLDPGEAPAQAAGFPKRLITITWTNGVIPDQFYPKLGPLDALPPLLAPLEPYKSKLLVPRQANAPKSPIDVKVMIDKNEAFSGHGAYPALLTGTWTGTISNPSSEGPSIDQMIANDLVSKGVAAPLLNLGARPYSSSTTWKSAGAKNTQQTDPYKVFNSLFTGVPTTPGMPPAPMPGTPSVDALKARRKSVLDFVGGELDQFANGFGAEDRARVQSHIEAIAQLEARLGGAAGGSGTGGMGEGTPVGAACAAPVLPSNKPNFNDVRNYPAHVSSMLALAGAAVKCDFARCITIDLIDDGGGNSLTFPWLDINSPDYHAIAHLGSSGYGDKAPIDVWFMQQVAALVGDLAAAPEGNGTVLDNTCILITNDMNEGANHWVAEVPYLIIGGAGGFFKQGEAVSLSRNVPNNQLLTSVCHAMGLEIAGIGAYSGDLDSVLRA